MPDSSISISNTVPGGRIFQTLTIICLTICGWLMMQAQRPQEQFHYIKFGTSVQLISITPFTQEAVAGKSIKFQVKWRLLAPLPPDRVIAYYLGNPNYSPLANLDTKQPSNGDADYTQVAAEGRVITDIIELKIPKNVKSGPYEVSTFIFPTDQFGLDEALRSPSSVAHRTLFIVHIKNDS